jgi:hypothetical protein
VSGRAFPWKLIRFARRKQPLLHEGDRQGCFEIMADAVSGPEMRKTAFSAQEMVQKTTGICGERKAF